MKNIDYKTIPKRISYHTPTLELPKNLIYHEWDENGDKQSFSIKWLENLVDKLDIKENNVQLAFPDGSVKDLYGGSGQSSSNLEYYKIIDLDKNTKSIIQTTPNRGWVLKT